MYINLDCSRDFSTHLPDYTFFHNLNLEGTETKSNPGCRSQDMMNSLYPTLRFCNNGGCHGFGLLCIFFIILWGTLGSVNAAVVNCQANRPSAGNNLYLYYASANDNNFPDDVGSIGQTTSPLPPFDVADLDSGIGTTAALRSAITERVKVDYCEFDVRVVESTSDNGTTNPTPTDSRWQVIGIGSDGNGGLFGIAQNVDIGDSLVTYSAQII